VGLKDNWQEIVSIAAFVLTGPGGLVALFTTNAFGIRDKVTEAFTEMKDWVLDKVMALKDGAVAKLGELLDWVRGLPGRILAALGDLSGLLWDAGRQVMEGLINGIKSKLGDLKDALGDVKDKIFGWKGPIEEDARLLIPHGQAIMEGLMAGIEGRLRDLRALLGDVTGVVAGLPGPVPAPVAAGRAAIVVNVTVQGPVYGELGFEERITGIVKDALRRGAFHGLIGG